MPRVPTYDNPQVSLNTQSVQQFAASEMPDVEGRQVQQLSQGLMSAGGAVSRIAADVQEEANKVRVIEAADKLERARLNLTYAPNAGFMHLKGANALQPSADKSLPQMYGEQFDDAVSTIAAGLSNDEQKRAFIAQAARTRMQLNTDMTRHVAGEFEAHRKSIFTGTFETAVQGAAAEWGNAEAVAKHADDARTSIGELAQISGVGGKEAEAIKVRGMSKLHTAVIEGAIQGNLLDYAREYLKQNTAELTPEARLQLTKMLDSGEHKAAVFTKTDEIWGAAAGDINKALEMSSKVDPKLRGDVEAQLRIYSHDQNAAQTKQLKDDTDNAWKVVVRDGSTKNIGSLWGKITGESQRQILDWVEAKARQKEALAKGKFEPDLNVYQGLVRMSVEEPDKFMNLNFTRYEPLLGDAITKQLIDMSGRMSKKDAQAESEQRLLRTALTLGDAQIRQAGINLKAKPGSSDAEKAAKFTTELHGEITALMQTGKADEKSVRDAVMRLTADWYKRGTFFGYNAKKGYEIPPEEIGNYVAKPFKDIPVATRDAIRQSFINQGRRPTEITDQMIERAYTRAYAAGEIQ